jgi:hypothetical protein
MQPPTKAATAEKAKTLINSRLPGLLPALQYPAAQATQAPPSQPESSTDDSAEADQNQLPLIIPGFKPRR